MATGGKETKKSEDVISEEERQILDVFHKLSVKPEKMETPEDLITFVEYVKSFKSGPSTKVVTDESSSKGSYQFPRISTFYGEDNKGDVSWETFYFEICSLLADKYFTDDQILLGIRRAVKGNASDVVRRLGIGVTVKEVLTKLESTFGNIETKESILRKFYSTKQSNESILSFSSKLEEIFTQAVSLKALKKTDDEILKQVLYQGLRPDIKHLAAYKCDTIDDYDLFKIELRKIEAELKSESESTTKRCNVAANLEKKETSEMSEVKDLLKKLNDRIDNIEKEKKQDQHQYNYNRFPRGYRGSWRGSNYRGYRGRGRNDVRPARPIGTNTFQPTCYNCNEKGHLSRNCPLNQPTCFKCNEKGHIAKHCPKE